MEKFKVKLNNVCTACRGNTLCCGMIVIPPLNFSTSKKEGTPNKDVVSWRYDWRITKYLNDALIKLMEAVDISEFLSSGSTANTTFVLFIRGKRSRDKMTTLIEGTPISSKMSSESCKMLSCSKETGFCT